MQPRRFRLGMTAGADSHPCGRMLVQVASLLDGEIRSQIGDAPVYLSFDSDSLDPAYVCWKLERLMWVV